MQQTALSLLRRDPEAYTDMIYPVTRGECDILQADEDGVILFDRPGAVVLANLPDTDGSVQKLMSVRGARVYCIHSDSLADRFNRVVRKKSAQRVSLCVYEGKTAPHTARVCSVRKLDRAEAEAVFSCLPYDDAAEYYRAVDSGLMYGAFISGEIAGRMGVHSDGSLGMLGVSASFRRRGVGEALVAYLVKEQLSRGVTPYGYIQRASAAASALMTSLGFSVSKEEITVLR